ncbi:MAG: TonB-dependent receptor, partial [Phenylobacterium zucineum]
MTNGGGRTRAARMMKLVLMAGAALAVAGPALGQTAPSDVEELVVTGSRLSEATVAIGTDEPTATVSITSDALLSAPAGITGLKMLESLPGFNVQANDALGMYEFGNSVSVRAFNFQQIGFLLDDIPMGRSDQFGGSPIYRYVDNENLARVTASSG